MSRRQNVYEFVTEAKQRRRVRRRRIVGQIGWAIAVLFGAIGMAAFVALCAVSVMFTVTVAGSPL